MTVPTRAQQTTVEPELLSIAGFSIGMWTKARCCNWWLKYEHMSIDLPSSSRINYLHVGSHRTSLIFFCPMPTCNGVEVGVVESSSPVTDLQLMFTFFIKRNHNLLLHQSISGLIVVLYYASKLQSFPNHNHTRTYRPVSTFLSGDVMMSYPPEKKCCQCT